MTVASFFSTQHEQSLKSGAAKYNDLFVVAGLAAIITLMILPLPLFLIDVLVAVNITFACMLLLSAVYISSVVEFSVFPSLLLISTLFRLALSVATTRLILLQADA
ncbi:MAG: FHIPEP family type III secretion protein, partial [Pseudomonadota bacterium]